MKLPQTIGVIGAGVVGKATARTYMELCEVRTYDMVPEKSTHTLAEVLACDLIFVCLPTVGGVDPTKWTECVDDFFKRMRDNEQTDKYFVLRSTTPLGTCYRIREGYGIKNLLHSPEFLTARCALTDAQIPARNIIGGLQCPARTMLLDLYKERFPGTHIHLCTLHESEAAKLVTNAFFATKVSFFNEIYALCVGYTLDWELIREMVLSDGRISPSHTKVPGPDGKRGFGGTCLPKDLLYLVSAFKDAMLHPYITQAAHLRNVLEDRKSDDCLPDTSSATDGVPVSEYLELGAEHV